MTTGMEEVRRRAADVLETAVEAAVAASARIRRGAAAAAMPLLADLSQGLEAVLQACGASEAAPSPASLVTLRRVNDGLERSDYVEVCDVIEHELVPLIRAWRDRLAPQAAASDAGARRCR